MKPVASQSAAGAGTSGLMSELFQFQADQPERSLAEFLQTLESADFPAETLVELACRDMLGRAARGIRMRTEDYLRELPQLNAPGLILELLDAELCACYEPGNGQAQDSLIQRFPEHASRILCMFQLCELEQHSVVAGRAPDLPPPSIPPGRRIVDRLASGERWLARPSGPRDVDDDDSIVLASNWSGFVDGLLELEFSAPLSDENPVDLECDLSVLADVAQRVVAFRHAAFLAVHEVALCGGRFVLTVSHRAGTSLETRLAGAVRLPWVTDVLSRLAYAIEAARDGGINIDCSWPDFFRVCHDDRIAIFPAIADCFARPDLLQSILDLTGAGQRRQLEGYGRLAGVLLTEICDPADVHSSTHVFWQNLAARCQTANRQQIQSWGELLDVIERQPQ